MVPTEGNEELRAHPYEELYCREEMEKELKLQAMGRSRVRYKYCHVCCDDAFGPKILSSLPTRAEFIRREKEKLNGG